MCYSIANRVSFENVWDTWYPELKPFRCPIVLVGTYIYALPFYCSHSSRELIRRKRATSDSFTDVMLCFSTGTKSDLYVGANTVRVEEGERLRRKINANQFLECSAKNNENINEVIYEAVRAAVNGRPEEEPEDAGCYGAISRCFSYLASYCSSSDRK